MRPVASSSNDLWSREQDDFRAAVLLLFDGGLLEAGQRDEIPRDGWAFRTFGVEGANELVHITAADRFLRRFALGNGPAGLETVHGVEVKLATRLVNVESGLIVAQGNEQIGHEPSEKIPATVVVFFENADRSRVHAQGSPIDLALRRSF